MKIGYLLQIGEEIRTPPFNGPANHIRQVIKELTRCGNHVCVIFRLEGQIWKSWDLENFQPIFIRKTNQGYYRLIERAIRRAQYELRFPYFALFESLRFAFACRQEIPECDLYYERASWMAYGGVLAARWQNVPWIAEYNGDPLSDLEAKGTAPRGVQGIIAREIFRKSLHASSHIVATGEGWRRSCIDDWGVDPAKITTVENGTDLLELLPRQNLSVFTESDPKERPTEIVYLGGFYPWHGVDILLQAIAGVVQQGANLHLTMIGAGDGEEAARCQVKSLGIEEQVMFTGRLSAESYAPYLANAEIGVSPYCGWKEYSGLKLFDYKAAGLACLASGENGQPVTLKHGETGWIVPPCDSEALSVALMQLINDSDLRHRLGRAARLDAERYHTWSKTVDQLESIFQTVL
jgi:alpha-maltose-1-phosphate synthase